MVGGSYNNITGNANRDFIGGGRYNGLTGTYSFIGGGSYNNANGVNSAIIGGSGNLITALSNQNGIFGGEFNNISQNNFNNKVIVGGYGNQMQDSPMSIMLGGTQNSINAGDDKGANATIAGKGNTIQSYTEYSTILGGYSNTF